MIVEPIGRRRQPLRIERDVMLAAKVRIDEAPQRLERRVGGSKRHRPGARAARGEAHDLDGDERQQPAHGEPIAFPAEKMLFVELAAQPRKPPELGGAGKRHHRIGRERLEPRERRAGLRAERHVLGEAHHPPVRYLRAESEAVGDGRRHQDRRGRLERQNRRLVHHLAAAALDHQDLAQVAVAVGEDRPRVERGARADGLHVDEIERLVVRRVAVEVKQRQRRRGRHGIRA